MGIKCVSVNDKIYCVESSEAEFRNGSTEANEGNEESAAWMIGHGDLSRPVAMTTKPSSVAAFVIFCESEFGVPAETCFSMESAEKSSAATGVDPMGTEPAVATTDPQWRFSHPMAASTPPRRAVTERQRAATRPLSSMTKLSFTRTKSAVALTCFRRKLQARGTKPSHRAHGIFGHRWNTDETRMGAGSF